ncbi:hypothetical protein H0H93_005455, partial [Arthromyces matolae]
PAVDGLILVIRPRQRPSDQAIADQAELPNPEERPHPPKEPQRQVPCALSDP